MAPTTMLAVPSVLATMAWVLAACALSASTIMRLPFALNAEVVAIGLLWLLLLGLKGPTPSWTWTGHVFNCQGIHGIIVCLRCVCNTLRRSQRRTVRWQSRHRNLPECTCSLHPPQRTRCHPSTFFVGLSGSTIVDLHLWHWAWYWALFRMTTPNPCWRQLSKCPWACGGRFALQLG